MAGGFHFYFEAARALWEMRIDRLETMARDAPSPGERRAAALTLNLKRELITPEQFSDERGYLTKLASSLMEDRQFTMEMALRITPKSKKRSTATRAQAGIAQAKPRHTVLWVAITAGVILLIMDVLATAGVPVPTPIGEILDRVTGEDESPVVPAPMSPERSRGRERDQTVGVETDAVPDVGTRSARDSRTNEDQERPTGSRAKAGLGTEPNAAVDTSPTAAPDKHPNHANGKDEHHAQGHDKRASKLLGYEKESPTPNGKAKGHDKEKKSSPPGG